MYTADTSKLRSDIEWEIIGNQNFVGLTRRA